MIKKLLLAVAVLIAAVLAFAATRPDSFRIERSLLVQAPPQAVYPQIADFHRWRAWSPFENLDPAMKRSYDGAERGLGAIYAWDGDKSGAGRMEIVEAVEPSRIRIQLDFLRPFKARNTAEFVLAAEGGGTRVSWAMYGADPYVGKLMGLFFDRDAMIGKDFEKGLASLKSLAESSTETPAAAPAMPADQPGA
jgi:uncharacterized protein YndB with AHSA1/START domain